MNTEKILSTSEGFKKLPNWLISKVMQVTKCRTQMICAAWVFVFMLDRAEASLRNNWIDPKNNSVYIYFTYADVKELLGCGKTTAWKIFRILKKSGLIDIRHQGFGFPNMIYVKTPDKRFENVKANIPEETIDSLKRRYNGVCGYEFTDKEIDEIITVMAKSAPTLTDNDRIIVLQGLYKTLCDRRKKKAINNPCGYLVTMIKNRKIRGKPQNKSANTPKKSSFDFTKIMEYAKNTPLV